MRGRNWALATAALPAMLLAACSQETTDEAADAAPLHYVAMGSSYAAGAGIGETKEGTPERCGRTVNNYSALLAASMGYDLDDQSCGGATTAHVLGPWDELPAQIDAVTPDTKLVTVTVGGNDLGYMGVVFGASCRAMGGLEFEGEVRPCPPKAELPSDEDYAAVETNLRKIAQQVHERAPDAKMVFVQYVRLIPETLCANTPIAPADAADAAIVGQRLAEATANAAKAEGAMLLPVDEMSATHTPCSDDPWATGLPEGYDGKSAPWHPNAAGHAAIAAALEEMLTS